MEMRLSRIVIFILSASMFSADVANGQRMPTNSDIDRKNKSGSSPKPVLALPNYIAASHQAVLRAWLETQKNWRLATDADVEPDELKRFHSPSNKNKHPFYAVGDFNRDKQEDFVVMLWSAKTSKSRKFDRIVIFNGPFSVNPISQPNFSLENPNVGDFIFWNGARIYIGPPESDSGFILVAKGKSYKIRE